MLVISGLLRMQHVTFVFAEISQVFVTQRRLPDSANFKSKG